MTDKMRKNIDLVLPSVSDIRDACVQRLTELLTAKEGIETTHATDNKGMSQDQICIHYDPERLSLGEVRELAKRYTTRQTARLSVFVYIETIYNRKRKHSALFRYIETFYNSKRLHQTLNYQCPDQFERIYTQ
ncbi:hypothetical protein [Gimesia sp.]|uniref:hypothetical protein n=1 Tax=Gimesia TaxID=1649453 RepID=UPI000C3AEC71|nr:hypothetical protein [Gimesia sp.]MAX38638.1 hypothetical protein [Gimesia sp.]HAH49696.1 hypothetical protein [Planctomycetaceae bacterium]